MIVLLPYEFLLEQNLEQLYFKCQQVLLPYEFLLEQNDVDYERYNICSFVTI